MEINGKVWCLFEQSGTFKNEFKKLGYEAIDVDIQNNFGETDLQIDIFEEIEKGYDDLPSIFDSIHDEDLILAFFPCIYFCSLSQCAMTYEYRNYKKFNIREKTEKIIERSDNRQRFFVLLIKMFSIAYERNLKLILENPWTRSFLQLDFVMQPTFVDYNRMQRGDYFIKPTAYWFLNCTPTNKKSFQNDKQKKEVEKSRPSSKAGICSEERSMISPDYARNFICDFILGIKQTHTQLELFDE